MVTVSIIHLPDRQWSEVESLRPLTSCWTGRRNRPVYICREVCCVQSLPPSCPRTPSLRGSGIPRPRRWRTQTSKAGRPTNCSSCRTSSWNPCGSTTSPGLSTNLSTRLNCSWMWVDLRCCISYLPQPVWNSKKTNSKFPGLLPHHVACTACALMWLPTMISSDASERIS